MDITLKKGDLIRFISTHGDQTYLYIYLYHYKVNCGPTNDHAVAYMRILNIQKSCRIESHMIRKGDFGTTSPVNGWEKIN